MNQLTNRHCIDLFWGYCCRFAPRLVWWSLSQAFSTFYAHQGIMRVCGAPREWFMNTLDRPRSRMVYDIASNKVWSILNFAWFSWFNNPWRSEWKSFLQTKNWHKRKLFIQVWLDVEMDVERRAWVDAILKCNFISSIQGSESTLYMKDHCFTDGLFHLWGGSIIASKVIVNVSVVNSSRGSSVVLPCCYSAMPCCYLCQLSLPALNTKQYAI